MVEIRPQPGKQEQFLRSHADIAFYGGAAGGGKSWALLIEAIRHSGNPNFGAVIFRRTSPQITNEGGLWDESNKVFPQLGAEANRGRLRWRFPEGAKVTFAHMQHEQNRFDWQGSQIPLIGYDELTHFTWRQFSYLLSRNRSTCGIRPYIRGTCNPDPDSWVADFISWWLDPDTGLAIEERSGVVRYFYTIDNEPVWGDTAEELIEEYGAMFETPDGNIIRPKSFTFVPSSVYDNRILLQQNPEYLANLKTMPKVDRERLLAGNWKIKESAGLYFQRTSFGVELRRPAGRYVRGWDLASTEPSPGNPDPDYTAGVLVCEKKRAGFCVVDVVRDQLSPGKVENLLLETAQRDGRDVLQAFFVDPGQAGKSQRLYLSRVLKGFKLSFIPTTKGKIEMASPVSAQVESGEFTYCKGMWNRAFFGELEEFPEGGHDDMVDGLSRAFYELTRGNTIRGGKALRG